jgi:hypothetical protein
MDYSLRVLKCVFCSHSTVLTGCQPLQVAQLIQLTRKPQDLSRRGGSTSPDDVACKFLTTCNTFKRAFRKIGQCEKIVFLHIRYKIIYELPEALC